jgi:ribosomal protein S12 methylthiotransferase
MAYLKIAEGCSRHCTYCIIPKLRGKQKSRLSENIVEEARLLILSGVKELVIVAQDTTGYGKDLNPDVNLGRLLETISDISPDVRIRLFYGHPESIDDSVIKIIAERKNICSYFDIPIQHASSSVLKKMGRHYTRKDLYRLFENIRSYDPDAALRTTAIVGFPGETDKDFEILLSFIEDVRFTHLGVFTYSDAEDLPSHKFSHKVSKRAAKKRYDRLMSRQSEISLENNRKNIGKILRVLVEESPQPDLFTGRSWFQGPEVDGITYIRNRQGISSPLQIGSFSDIIITDALEYDLIGEPV